jgi:hypothetical protein
MTEGERHGCATFLMVLLAFFLGRGCREEPRPCVCECQIEVNHEAPATAPPPFLR